MSIFPDPPDPSLQEEIPLFPDSLGQPLTTISFLCLDPPSPSGLILRPALNRVNSGSSAPRLPSLLPPAACLQLGEYQTVVQVAGATQHLSLWQKGMAQAQRHWAVPLLRGDCVTLETGAGPVDLDSLVQ